MNSSRFSVCTPAALLVVCLGLTSCVRLYEPERYTRLSFAPDVRRTRVLMIGNSLTYYNDLPGLLQQLSAGEERPVEIEKITRPYASLKDHWAAGQAVRRIQGGHFDVVILQDFSRNPVTHTEESLEYFSRFAGESAKAGARVIVFENWTRRGLDEESAALFAAYARIIGQTGAALAPIGSAWRRLERDHPDVDLRIDDRHPTDAGTYLAAAVLYDVVYHKPSGRLPATLAGPALSGDLLPWLRQTADETTAVAITLTTQAARPDCR